MPLPTLLLIALFCVLSLSPECFASGIADAIVAPYRNNSHDIAQTFLLTARSLFWKLAALQFAVMSLSLILQKGDIGEWAMHLIPQILSIGFYSYLMEHSYEFSCDIIQGLRAVGQNNGALSPQNIFSVGEAVALNIIHHVSFTDLTLALVQGLSALIVCCGFSLIAALIIVALCEGYVLIGVGVLLTGLGGSHWTRDFAHKAFIMSFGIGIKLLTFYMLYQVGYQEMRHWTTLEFHTAKDCLGIVGGTLIYLLLMLRLPQLAQQTIHGAIAGSTALENMTQLITHTERAAGFAMGTHAATSAGLQAAQTGAKMDQRKSKSSGANNQESPSTLGKLGGRIRKPLIFAGRATRGAAKAARAGLGDEIYGRLTGSKLRSGTSGGRIAHYIHERSKQDNKNQNPPKS